MAFKININTPQGKTFKLETEALALEEKELGQTIKGEDVSPDLAGYELEITGASDKQGFTSMKEVEGFARKKPLLKYGKAMHKKSKGDKKINRKPAGIRLRKTVRGKIISSTTSQINLKLIKEGTKKLTEIFADQNKTKNDSAGNEEKSSEQQVEPSLSTGGQSDNNKPAENPEPIKEETPAEDKTNPEKEPQTPKSPTESPEQEPKEKITEDKVNPDKEPTE